MTRILTLASGQQVAVGAIDVNFPPFLIDLFGRLRTSDPVIQLQITQSDPSIAKVITEGEASGTGTSATFFLPSASTILSVDNSLRGLRRFRTRVPGLYQAGKSLILLFTFNLITEGDLFWTLRASVSGSIVETSISQSNWNRDKCDGTGLSGFAINQTKCHIGFMAFEWLGVGDVVCGFFQDRQPIVAHIFEHKNALTDVYMRTANLFPCFEIEKTNTTIEKRLGYYDISDGVYLRQSSLTGNQLKVICSSLINEGAIDRSGSTFAITRLIGSNFNTGTANTGRILLAFSLKPTTINSRVLVTKIDFVLDTNTNYYLYLCRQPNITGTYTPNFTDFPNHSVRYDSNPPDTLVVTNPADSAVFITSGTALNTQAGTAIQANINSIDYLGSTFDNNPELWCIVIVCGVPNASITNAVVNFIEEI